MIVVGKKTLTIKEVTDGVIIEIDQKDRVLYRCRDLISFYYFLIKNIYLYISQDIETKTKDIKIKNSVLTSNIIETDIEKYRTATIIINKNAFRFNLASMFEAKRKIEKFFEKQENCEMKFNNNRLIITKKQESIFIQSLKTYNKKIYNIKDPIVRMLVRNIKEKFSHDLKAYLVETENFSIREDKKTGKYIIRISQDNIEVSRDFIIALSLVI